MKFHINILCIIAISTVLIGCQSNSLKPSSPLPLKKLSCDYLLESPRPSWTNKTHIQGYYVGIGIAEYSEDNEKGQRKQAYEDALGNLAKSIAAKVFSKTQTHIQDDNGNISSHSELINSVSAELRLQQVIHDKWWLDKKTCQLWTRTLISEDIAERIKREQASEMATIAEQTLWDSVKDSRSIEDLETYLIIYEFGKFTPQARNKIKQIEEARAQNLNRKHALSQTELINLKDTAKSGDPSAQIKYANTYIRKKQTSPEQDLAIVFLNKVLSNPLATNEQRAIANINLGTFFLGGLNSHEKNIDQAIIHFLTAIKISNDESALFKLGSIYLTEPGYIDFKLGASYLKQAAEQNHKIAAFMLGNAYSTGAYQVKKDQPLAEKYLLLANKIDGHGNFDIFLGNHYAYDFPTLPLSKRQLSINYYTRSAKRGAAIAYCQLAAIYLSGQFVNQNFKLANTYATKGASRSQPACYFILGQLHASQGFIIDEKKAFNYFKLASDSGYPAAQRRLADFYLNGTYVDKDIEQAKVLYERSAQNGDIESEFYLGILYEEGKFGQVNITKAKQHYKKAALKGSIKAQINLGFIYSQTNGALRNYTLATKYFGMAANAGSNLAHFYLGQTYYFVDEVSDPKKGLEHMKKAAAQGIKEAQLELGRVYYLGLNTPVDNKQAQQYLNAAYENGSAEAAYILARIYELGKGVKSNLNIALDYYLYAANFGHTESQYYLGVLNYGDSHLPKNMQNVIKWTTLAADNGHISAQHNLGYLYYKGEGVKKDFQKAFEYFQKASNQGDANAQQGLGELYELGLGTKKDIDRAVKLYQLAADQGQKDAKLRLLYLEKERN